MPSPERPSPESWLLRAARAVVLYTVRLPVRVALRARVLGEERVPWSGGLIVAANHSSFADPVVLQSYFPRHLTYLMTAKYYGVTALHWFFRFWGALRVKEEGVNKAALRGATRVLERGGAVAIFPEGGISRDGAVHDPQLGVALLAQRAGVPVLPVGMSGVERVLPPDTWRPHCAPVAISIGEPILPRGESRAELAARVADAIRTCVGLARDCAGRGREPA